MLNKHINDMREILNMPDNEDRRKKIAELLEYHSNSNLAPDVPYAAEVAVAFMNVTGLAMTSFDVDKHTPENLCNFVQTALGMSLSVINKLIDDYKKGELMEGTDGKVESIN